MSLSWMRAMREPTPSAAAPADCPTSPSSACSSVTRLSRAKRMLFKCTMSRVAAARACSDTGYASLSAYCMRKNSHRALSCPWLP